MLRPYVPLGIQGNKSRTHYLTSVVAGGVIVKDEYFTLDETSIEEQETTDMKISASVAYLDMFSMDMSYGQSNDKSNTASSKQMSQGSSTYSYGGPPLSAQPNASHWLSQLPTNLVSKRKCQKLSRKC